MRSASLQAIVSSMVELGSISVFVIMVLVFAGSTPPV